MKISIVGSGNMAHGIGTRLVAGKHPFTIYDRDESKAKNVAQQLGKEVKGELLSEAISGDIIFFTLPFAAIPEVINTYKDQLAGKILVDISNPVDFKTFQLIPPPGTSGAEEIAKHLPPGAKLIKAFNTTFAGTLVAGTVDGKKLDVFIAGDDTESKKIVAQIVEDGGMRAIDVGSLSNARHLEGFQLIHMTLQSKLGNTWMTGIKILP